MEEWVELPFFPDYSVSHLGRVRSDRSNRILSITINQNGIPYIGLTKGGSLFKRSIAPLVARAFLPIPEFPSFDTPINLDGDRLHCSVDNLLWRPRWFAVSYHRQFMIDRIWITSPIEDVDTEERFETSLAAAKKYGLLDREIMQSVQTEEYVWPTYQRFRILQNRY